MEKIRTLVYGDKVKIRYKTPFINFDLYPSFLDLLEPVKYYDERESILIWEGELPLPLLEVGQVFLVPEDNESYKVEKVGRDTYGNQLIFLKGIYEIVEDEETERTKKETEEAIQRHIVAERERIQKEKDDLRIEKEESRKWWEIWQ